MRKYLVIINMLFVTMFISINAQNYEANEILSKVKAKINSVQDYSADIDIKVDVNFLKVPETHAKIFFKQPDKIKMESDGFALLPRQGLNFSPTLLLQDDYTAVYAKQDTVDGYPVHLIKILPLSDQSNVILSNLYIDKEKYVVRKIETTTKNSGTITLNLHYDERIDQALPSEVKITFKVEQMNLPPGMTGEFESNQETQKNGKMAGTVTVFYKNYKVNQGISDDFFEEEDKDKKEKVN